MTMTQLTRIHKFYLGLCIMVNQGLDVKSAHRMFGELLNDFPCWRVVGVTEGALLKFRDQNWESRTRQGIQRSHLENRQKRNIELLTHPMTDPQEWYDTLMSRDKTVLALSSENKRLESTDHNVIVHWFDNQESLGLFETHGFKWTHKEDEKTCLECLYSLTR